MDAGEKFLLIDVREDNEWARGHIPNAVHLGRGIIERDIEQRILDTGAKLLLYCGGFRSALVAENLQKMGYTNVESMDGGWRGWFLFASCTSFKNCGECTTGASVSCQECSGKAWRGGSSHADCSPSNRLRVAAADFCSPLFAELNCGNQYLGD